TPTSSPKWGPYFSLDPIFPTRLLEAGYARIVDFINTLYEDYSKRGLTNSTDRAMAISGLQTRLARTLGCQESYGVFDSFLCRNLLWQRGGEKMMERIEHKDLKVPSWSWTAYLGGIKFVGVPFHDDVLWHKDLKLDVKHKASLQGSLGKLRNYAIEQKGSQHVILDSRGAERGWLQFDIEDHTDIDPLRYLVVGRIGEKSENQYYVLVVRQTRRKREYKRVGVGLVHASHISRWKDNVRIV
ncbi:hypothetical protein F5882DRAFT_311646, partial [Hyaloscypha sp. PMI_1271]